MRFLRASKYALLLCIAGMFATGSAIAQSSATSAAPTPTPEQAQLLKSAEAFLRNLFTWGPTYQVKVGPLTPSPSPDFYTVPIEVTVNGQSDKGTVFVSKDGKTFIRGEMFDMSADPFAETRSKLRADLAGAPSLGPVDAKVTLIEFSDFECPHCLEFHNFLRDIRAKYPQLRIVHKDFPISQIHPWAETAAIAGRCAFQQSPAAFWKISDFLFSNQDLISASNVWDKVTQFASDANLDQDAFKACLASPQAKKAVDDSLQQGVALGITGTPAIYINGRQVLSVTPETISEFIDYELAAIKK
ncbi:MAG TPA: thioredoxin domain-containing protein [Candidatus Acidoferrales bacterium]|nr:thioredoxin domain-containing protein [Candidatus Acidoferrales bacterium]